MIIRKEAHNQSIDIVIPICDGWRVPYLQNCLNSLRNQSNQKAIKNIILAFAPPGYNRNRTDNEHIASKKDIEQLAQIYGVIFVDGQNDYPLYSLAYSRNLGAKRAKSLIVGFIDCDLVLHPKTIEHILLYMGPAQATCVFASRMPYKPENEVYRDFTNFSKNICKGTRDTAGKGGGCFFIDRLLFNRIGGYDERIFGWGFEDVDMLNRLQNESCMIGNLISEDIFAMHQYHEPFNYGWNDKNRFEENKRIAFSSSSVARNPNGFGKP